MLRRRVTNLRMVPRSSRATRLRAGEGLSRTAIPSYLNLGQRQGRHSRTLEESR
jgi:hypothetical protein